MPQLTTPKGALPQSRVTSMRLERFRGIDLTSGEMNVDASRSPNAVNIMPDGDGFPKKRPGWKCEAKYPGPVFAAHRYTPAPADTSGDGPADESGDASPGEILLIHAGNKLYIYGEGPAGNAAGAAAEDGSLEEGEDAPPGAPEPVYTGMAERPSVSVQLGGKLWILDGEHYLYFCVEDGVKKCGPVREIATVPLITIAKAPNGKNGATAYRPVNLLSGRRTDSYAGTATDTTYALSFNGLSTGEVTVKKLTGAAPQSAGAGTGTPAGDDGTGIWQDVAPAAYTVNRAAGTVTFAAAPGESPVEGEDNVRITYEVSEDGAGEQIDGCTAIILYGVKGALDRVFMGGNPAQPNVDYWSEWNDPAYMGDTFYGVLGQEGSPIIGYNVLGSRLVTLKAGEENGRNIFVREGVLDDEGFAAFNLVGVIQGEGAVSARCFASLSGEPLYLSARGVQALTPSDITGERYAQSRSYYIDGGLCREEGLQDACAAVFGSLYAIAVGGPRHVSNGSEATAAGGPCVYGPSGTQYREPAASEWSPQGEQELLPAAGGGRGRLYLLDGRQKTYESRQPHSTYQFEGYLWEGIPAQCLFTKDGALYFGTAGGRVCRFKDAGAGSAGGAYSDEEYLDGEDLPAGEAEGDAALGGAAGNASPGDSSPRKRAVRCWWATPLMELGEWGRLKTVTGVWVASQPYTRSGGVIYYATDREHERAIREYFADVFDWNDVDFNRFTFNTLRRPGIVAAARKAKKVKLFQVRVENSRLDEPFGILAIQIDYRTGGRIRR